MGPTNPFDSMRHLADLWGRGGKVFLSAQHGAVTEMADRLRKFGEAKGGEAFGLDAFAMGKEASELAAAQGAFAELWGAATALSTSITKTLHTSDASDPAVAEMLGRIFDPRHWFASTEDMDDALNRFAEGPRLADLWQIERRMGALGQAWVELRRRSLEHDTVKLDTWIGAAKAFTVELDGRAERGEVIESWRDFVALWVETANNAMLESQRSEPFLATQRDLLNASAAFRLAQQDVAAYFGDLIGQPTRAEIDDVHKTVTELRRELRALKRELRASGRIAEENA